MVEEPLSNVKDIVPVVPLNQLLIMENLVLEYKKDKKPL